MKTIDDISWTFLYKCPASLYKTIPWLKDEWLITTQWRNDKKKIDLIDTTNPVQIWTWIQCIDSKQIYKLRNDL